MILIVGSVIIKTSYSYFVKTDEIENIDIRVGALVYNLTSTDLVDGTILVGANESKTFDIEINSLNKISSKYQVYYTSEDNLENVVVGYLKGSTNLPNGDIDVDGNKKVTIVIQNNSDSDITITLGVVGGMASHSVDDIVLEDTYQKLVNELDPVIISERLFAVENLGDNCKTYDDGIDTFLVGQCSQNYVWYSGKLWRVVLKNNETSAVKMVTDNSITAIPYNASLNTTFENSYVDQWLNQEFLPTLHDYSDYLVVDSLWDATEDTSDTPTRPVGTAIIRTVGLLNYYEYYTTYANSNSLATTSTGYLNNGVIWWLITPSHDDRFAYVRLVLDNGILYNSYPTIGRGVRPSVYLKSTIQISGGTGTQSDPYILEGDIQKPENGTTLLNTRYSGEYITFNNELYRIVGVEEGLTKITALDKPSALSSNKFHSAEGITSFGEADIKTDLENYYQGLDNTCKNMIQPNTTWYLGQVGEGVGNYKAGICATVDTNTSACTCARTTTTTTASIALPRVGEMFTSPITRGIKTYFWTLTPYNVSNVGYMNKGNLEYSSPTGAYGARPSMYLKSTVKIASNSTGNGTYEHPYSLSLN